MKRHLVHSILPLLFLFVLPLQAELAPEAGLVTLSAENTSVNEILEILAQRSGLNIITSPEVQSRSISIHLEDSSFDEAFHLVVRAAGLGFERVGSSILVAPHERFQLPTGKISRVYDLNYARADEVSDMLGLLGGSVTANERENRILIRGTQSQLEEAERILEELDRKPDQVFIEARLIEVNLSDLMELGVDWEKLAHWKGIFSEGDPGVSAPGALPGEMAYTPAEGGQSFFRQLESFELAVDALISEGYAMLLSDVKVVTLDGEAAEIFAGETVPVMISSLQSSAAAGAFQTVQLEKIDVGVRLNITPRVDEDGFITTLVVPEVSRILRFVGTDEDLPQTSTRRAQTRVRVRDGEKIYLGGLLSEEERRTVKKLPLLGSIPILGRLFQYTKVENVNLDLLIEITPRIVGDEGSRLPQAPRKSQQSGGGGS
ncbi:MAG: secretin N-terminal domain-containing protein [Candidatus Krumholzibacteria bacterium]|jgi:type II secretory pathway component GspD/PulD (secretin)|nr:secretin N-terminal domain-containing protein [Candidatus Krumholzibacteria bacterium]MDP6668535.1 secretin N-terminal domain-containing protein [Candidatus Krumholzibacteria bacterium]MDP6797791.1 secretin N-terminal domain-containing protein [Candidatus Krumholzibacteria bacterium]MDP7021416.1 secretin N-terminal domain-containing protein [Candidatus Krumholzibacteria bacterium]